MPKLGLKQPADLERLKRHRPSLHKGLAVEHADDGVDRRPAGTEGRDRT